MTPAEVAVLTVGGLFLVALVLAVVVTRQEARDERAERDFKEEDPWR